MAIQAVLINDYKEKPKVVNVFKYVVRDNSGECITICSYEQLELKQNQSYLFEDLKVTTYNSQKQLEFDTFASYLESTFKLLKKSQPPKENPTPKSFDSLVEIRRAECNQCHAEIKGVADGTLHDCICGALVSVKRQEHYYLLQCDQTKYKLDVTIANKKYRKMKNIENVEDIEIYRNIENEIR